MEIGRGGRGNVTRYYPCFSRSTLLDSGIARGVVLEVYGYPV